MKFAIYDPATGEITSIVTSHHTLAEFIALGNVAVVFNLPNPEGHYIDISSKAPVAKPPKPDHHRWDAAGKSWVLDPKQVPSYQDRRAAEYPSVQEQLEALWAGGQEEADMRKQISAIQAKYPAPN